MTLLIQHLTRFTIHSSTTFKILLPPIHRGITVVILNPDIKRMADSAPNETGASYVFKQQILYELNLNKLTYIVRIHCDESLVLLTSFYNVQFLTGAKIFRQFSVQPNREYKDG